MTSFRLQILSIAAACLLLAAGFLFQRQFTGVAISALFALLWFIGVWRAQNWLIHIAFTLTMCAAAFAAIAGSAPLFSLGVVLFSLSGWDLSRFTPLVGKIDPPAAALRLETIHLRRLGLTFVLGAAAGLAANMIHIELSFSLAMLLGLLAVIFLALSARELSRSDNDHPPFDMD